MTQLSRLHTDNIITGYDRNIVIKQMSINIPNHQISVIIGANACGKSTLLKSFARLIKPFSGYIKLDDKNIHQYPSKKIAKIIGLLPQSPIVPEGITVADLVSRGRFPYQSAMKGLQPTDYIAIEEALELMGIKHLADSPVDELSGGQRQRVWIAMSLAQQTEILLLDEPTTYLDINHQLEILDLLTDLNQKKGTTIVMVLHDINLSARYADYLFALKKGVLIAEGTPSSIVNVNLIKDVFNMDCQVINDPVSGTPFIIPIGRHHFSCASS